MTTILYAFMPDGGFLAGDTATGRASYAYPGSLCEARASRGINAAANMARTMVRELPNITLSQSVREREEEHMAYLRRNGTVAFTIGEAEAFARAYADHVRSLVQGR